MKLKIIKISKALFRYTLMLSLLLFTFCESIEVDLTPDAVLTKDSKVIALMKSVINSGSAINLTKSGDNDQCTEFLYPITILSYEETPVPIIITSDEELRAFIDSLNNNNYFNLIYPISLMDDEGGTTQLWDLEALVGTLEMALDACGGNGDDNTGDDNTGDNTGDDNTGDNSGDDDTGDNSGDDDTGDNSGDDNTGDNSGDDDDDDNVVYDFCHKNNKKVYICHKGNTICVSVNAIWGHLTQHEEDFLGQCE